MVAVRAYVRHALLMTQGEHELPSSGAVRRPTLHRERARLPSLLRGPERTGRVSDVELFFDLVFVFAITQLSHALLKDLSVAGAVRTGLLLVMVWLVWVYTTWVTTWVDPERLPTRAMLLVLALASLVFSAALPEAFGDRGLVVGVAYGGMQVGRSCFAVGALRGERQQRNFQRILCWCLASGALAVSGGLLTGQARPVLWAAAVAVDLLGGSVGFATPGLGRSRTADWDIDPHHIAERCQAFVLIALGESVVITGATLSELRTVSAPAGVGVALAFAGAAGFWWVYFDRASEAGAQVLAAAEDPGRLARSAYHLVHPILIAGIIVSAAADERVLAHPSRGAGAATSALLLGGTALFLGGHAAFKALLWRVVPWTRVLAAIALLLLEPIVQNLPAVTVSCFTLTALAVVSVADRTQLGSRRHTPEHG